MATEIAEARPDLKVRLVGQTIAATLCPAPNAACGTTSKGWA